jgi:saccharopine dehydrogenase-like NADP-dependent oxidoreductase
MTKRILIIGGYGNFGQFIAKKLAQDSNIQLIIAGRDEAKAVTFCHTLEAVHAPQSAKIDINNEFKRSLAALKPDIVIHTSGPYQEQGYHVANACIEQGCHYIDLADAREFVAGITTLNKAAKERAVLVCSGASSVPCLTGGIVDKYKGEFRKLESLEYGIATAQLTNRGLATTLAVLSYAGKPFKTLIDGSMQDVYGWLNLRVRRFWELNDRVLGNCDIPDLEIFPARYPDLKSIRFQAGLELKGLHITLWALSGLVKLKLLPSLQPMAPYLLKISRLFDPFGNDNSGFYMTLSGIGKDNSPKEITFDLVARHGDGLYIPSMPAILLAKKLAGLAIAEVGAYPCLGFISLDEYLAGLSEFEIKWRVI